MDTTLKTFSFDELEVLGGKARRAEYITARAEGRLEEAGFSAPKPVTTIKSDFTSSRPASDSAPRPQSDNRNRRPPNRPQGSRPASGASNAPRPASPQDRQQTPRPAQSQQSATAPGTGGAPKKSNNNRRRKNNRFGKNTPGSNTDTGAGSAPQS
jgi:hypothetical protein